MRGVCRVCGRHRCDPRCENYLPPHEALCLFCGEGLRGGEDAVALPGGRAHLSCLAQLSLSELLEACGYKIERGA